MYPFNLIDDLLLGEEFYSELGNEEIVQEVENIILSLSEIYVVNKYIPKKPQDVIHFWYAEWLSYKEIGNTLDTSSSRVGQLNHYRLEAGRLDCG